MTRFNRKIAIALRRWYVMFAALSSALFSYSAQVRHSFGARGLYFGLPQHISASPPSVTNAILTVHSSRHAWLWLLLR